jgi:hypothetical protein
MRLSGLCSWLLLLLLAVLLSKGLQALLKR